jgi:putative polyhydroxyalkanoate system protein
MADIFIVHPHRYPEQDIPQLLERLSIALERKIDARCEIDGKQLRFSRSGAKGKLLVDEDNLVIEVELGFMLKPMKGMIEQQILEELTRL